MAYIEEEIFARLNTYAGVSALVSGRIYPIHLPQNPTYPCVVYTRIANEHINNLDGSAGLSKPWIQIDAWADDPMEARDIGEQIRLGLQGYSGSPASGVKIHGVELDSDRETYEYEVMKYRHSADYFVWHSEVTS